MHTRQDLMRFLGLSYPQLRKRLDSLAHNVDKDLDRAAREIAGNIRREKSVGRVWKVSLDNYTPRCYIYILRLGPFKEGLPLLSAVTGEVIIIIGTDKAAQVFTDAYSHLNNLQQLRICLETKARSALLWHCLAREYWYENQPEDILSDQLTALDDSLECAACIDPDLACDCFQSYCESNTCSTRCGNSVGAVDPQMEVVHYVKESSFTRHVLRKCVIDDSYGNADDEARADSDYLVMELRKGNISSAFLASKRAVLSSSRGYFWVTRSAEVNSRLVGLPDVKKAERIRELVGLASLFEAEGNQGRLLIEVRIPADILTNLRLPTVFDANGRSYFRPAFRNDRWGETIDLRSLREGVPEAIHEKIIWKEEISNPEPVGELPTTPRILTDLECTRLLKHSKSMLNDQWKKKVFPRQTATSL